MKDFMDNQTVKILQGDCLELMKYLVKTYTNESETVLDFTMGSGTVEISFCSGCTDWGVKIIKERDF